MAYIGNGTDTFVRNEYTYTATAGQTSFSATYSVGYIDVFWNGFKLDSSEYTANNGTAVVLNNPALSNDKIQILAYNAFNIINIQNVTKDSSTGSGALPAGTTAQRTAAPTNGMVRFNNDINSYEGYANGVWKSLGGAVGGGSSGVFYENEKTVTADYTITSSKNAMSAGPITIANGVTVTIPDGSVWTIV
jgi:hypothetical protein